MAKPKPKDFFYGPKAALDSGRFEIEVGPIKILCTLTPIVARIPQVWDYTCCLALTLNSPSPPPSDGLSSVKQCWRIENSAATQGKNFTTDLNYLIAPFLLLDAFKMHCFLFLYVAT